MLTELAFTKAYRKHSSFIARVAVKVTNGSADAEDVAQDAWAEVWRARAKISMDTLRGLLCTLVRRLWWRRLNRDGQRHDNAHESLSDDYDAPIDGDQEKRIDALDLEWAVGDLKPVQSKVVAMTLDGLGPKEIEIATNRTENAVRTALAQGVENLRAWFNGGLRPSRFPLTPKQIEWIKSDRALGSSLADLASRYGTSRLTITKALEMEA